MVMISYLNLKVKEKNMINEITNMFLAKQTGISLAKIRRLSYDFLPPDPAATLQSGKARTYNRNEAFEIYLANHLIAEIKFKVVEAKAILNDIGGWLRKKGQYPDPAPDADAEPDDYINENVVQSDTGG